MRPNATLLALAAALSAAVAATPSFAAGAPPVPVLQVAAAKGDDAGEGRTAGDDFGVRPEVMARLSPEQIASILREREMRRPRFPSRPDPVAMTLFFGSLLAMVTIAQVFATRRERIRQQTLLAMVEKGLEIPHDLIAAPRISRWCARSGPMR